MAKRLKHTDFILVSDTGKEFACNKSVLAFHSTVFEANFEMKESKEVHGRMKTLIKECPEEAANLMVRVNKKFVEC